jgi:hypothetical protein
MLQFPPQKGINEVEKTYNGQQVKKICVVVVDPNNGSNAEKFFDIGNTSPIGSSARLIVDNLKAGHRMLMIERIGSGKDTLYIPTEESNIP